MFTMDELSIIQIYASEGNSRCRTISNLTDCLLFVDDDGLWHLISGLIEKLDTMTDGDFDVLDLSETLAILP